jgi:hypothetical protein
MRLKKSEAALERFEAARSKISKKSISFGNIQLHIICKGTETKPSNHKKNSKAKVKLKI